MTKGVSIPGHVTNLTVMTDTTTAEATMAAKTLRIAPDETMVAFTFDQNEQKITAFARETIFKQTSFEAAIWCKRKRAPRVCSILRMHASQDGYLT